MSKIITFDKGNSFYNNGWTDAEMNNLYDNIIRVGKKCTKDKGQCESAGFILYDTKKIKVMDLNFSDVKEKAEAMDKFVNKLSDPGVTTGILISEAWVTDEHANRHEAILISSKSVTFYFTIIVKFHRCADGTIKFDEPISEQGNFAKGHNFGKAFDLPIPGAIRCYINKAGKIVIPAH